MQIRISKINPPRPGDPEKGWKPTKNYQIFDESGTKYLAGQDKNVGSLQEGDMLNIETSQPDRFGNVYIQSYEPIKDVNADIHEVKMKEIKKAFPDSQEVRSSNGYSTIQPSNANNLQSLLPNNQYMIVLQTILKTSEKPEDRDLALKWFFDNLKAGVVATHSRLSGDTSNQDKF